MPTITKSTQIKASVEKVFEYVSDPMTTLEWIPSMMEVSDVTGSGADLHYHWKYKMVGIPFDGESSFREYVPNERTVVEGKGGIPNKITWTFKPHESGTKANIEVEYTIPVPVLGKFAEKLVRKRNEREVDMWLQNVKERLEV